MQTEDGDVIGYTYDTADNLSAIIYPDGTKVSYEYDKNDNLIKVTDREGLVTTYVYDALNRITEIHRPNGVSTYNTYNARDQIVELTNICDDCEWVVSKYSYTYDERGFIVAETAIESLAGYAYDDKHNGKHADGKHDDLYPHGTKHNKHDKDATFAYQIVQTDRTFTYDDAGKLLSATETEDNYGTYVYTYEYDLMGNRTAVYKTDSKGKVVESEEYSYNESNQVVKVALYDGKKNTTITYTYDKDGNRISEIGKIGTDEVEKYYEYTVENRLAAVYDKDELLMAVAYDGDGNRVFQLNYNLHTDEDWKGNSGNGNGNNKDNSGSGNNGKGNSNNGKGNSKSTGTDDAGYGNATNAEEHNSQNQSGILFPIDEEVSETEQSLIDQIKTTGKEKNYELIEYLNDVNREYVEVLVEQNINGKTDTSYVYGVNRLSLDRFDGSTGYYLYDPRGSVVGITNEEGQLYQSYRYSVIGEITFGAPQYENEYTYNGESYNPNIESQYLRARYYNVVTATFLTEDSYLGNINEPLTLNRYNYCVSSYLNYRDPSGNMLWPSGTEIAIEIGEAMGEVLTENTAAGETDFSLWDVVIKYATNKAEEKQLVRNELEDVYSEQLQNTRLGKLYLNTLALPQDIVAIPMWIREKKQGNTDIDPIVENVVANYNAGMVGYLYELGNLIIDPTYLLSTGILNVEGTIDGAGALIDTYRKAGSKNEFILSIASVAAEKTLVEGMKFWRGESDAQIARGAGETTIKGILAYAFHKTAKNAAKCEPGAKSNALTNGVEGSSDVLNNLKPQNLMDELAGSGVKYNPDDVLAVTKTADGKLLWLEQGNTKSGLTHILERHADDFASQGIDDIPQLLNDVLKNTPIKTGSNSKGLFADYALNGNTYRVAYGTNGYIVSFYPID